MVHGTWLCEPDSQRDDASPASIISSYASPSCIIVASFFFVILPLVVKMRDIDSSSTTNYNVASRLGEVVICSTWRPLATPLEVVTQTQSVFGTEKNCLQRKAPLTVQMNILQRWQLQLVKTMCEITKLNITLIQKVQTANGENAMAIVYNRWLYTWNVDKYSAIVHQCCCHWQSCTLIH